MSEQRVSEHSQPPKVSAAAPAPPHTHQKRYLETEQVVVGYSVGEMRERVRVYRELALDGLSVETAVVLLKEAAQGLLEPRVETTIGEYTCCDSNVVIMVSGWKPEATE